MNGQPLRYLSLFSGIGGFDLGFDRAGMVCAGQVEYDEKARAVLAKHWPDVPRLNDVREVQGHEFGTVDVIAGGFPCQDVSVAGRRAGLAGERSGLWFEFHRIVDRVKPRVVVIENVPGLLSSNGGQDFATVLRGLVECGYGVAWRILDAQYFGVPQRRRRVFIVGSLGDGRAAEVLFERDGGGGDSPTGGRPGQDGARTIATGSNSNRSDWETEKFVTATLNSGGNNGGFRTEPGEHLVTAFQPRYYTRDNKTGGKPDATADITNAHKAGDSAPHVLAFSAGNGADSYGIGLTENGTPPLRAGNSGTNMTPTVAGSFGVRRLTPVECERLQGFPDGWTEYSLEPGQCVIMGAWLNHFVQLPDVIARSLTERTASVLCTTSGLKNTEVQIYQSETTPPLPDAKSVTGWLGPVDVVDYAPDTINHGSATAILCNQKGIPLKEPPIPHGANGITVLRLNLLLDGPYSAERLSTISTWTQGITPLLISTYAKTQPSMVEYTLHWNAQPPNLSQGGLWCLRAANIGRCSDSARYRQLGNAVAVPVAEWIGRRIVAAKQQEKPQ